MKENAQEKVSATKRDFIKKAALTAFTIPVVHTFTVGELRAQVSGNRGVGEGRGGGNGTGNEGRGND